MSSISPTPSNCLPKQIGEDSSVLAPAQTMKYAPPHDNAHSKAPMEVPAIASDFITPPTYTRDVTTVALVTPDSEHLTAPIRGAPVNRRFITKSRSNILRECATVTPDQSVPSPSSSSNSQFGNSTKTVAITKTNLNNLAPSPVSRSFSREYGDHTSASMQGNNYEIFVGDLSFFCKEMDLYELFCPYGQVLKPRIRRSDKDGRTLMYGFVEMPVLEDAEKAVRALQGSRFQGRDIRVEISKCKAERIEMQQHQPPKARSKAADFQVHVTFTSQFPHNQVVRPKEELLRSIFEEYGQVRDIALKEYVMNKDSSTQEGFFFVSFGGYEEASVVVDQVDRSTIQGFTFRCSLSYNNNGEETPHTSHHVAVQPSGTNHSIKSTQSTPKHRSQHIDTPNSISRGMIRENSNQSDRSDRHYQNQDHQKNSSNTEAQRHGLQQSRVPSHAHKTPSGTTLPSSPMQVVPASPNPGATNNPTANNYNANIPAAFPHLSYQSHPVAQNGSLMVPPNVQSNNIVGGSYSQVQQVQPSVMYIPMSYGPYIVNHTPTFSQRSTDSSVPTVIPGNGITSGAYYYMSPQQQLNHPMHHQVPSSGSVSLGYGLSMQSVPISLPPVQPVSNVQNSHVNGVHQMPGAFAPVGSLDSQNSQYNSSQQVYSHPNSTRTYPSMEYARMVPPSVPSSNGPVGIPQPPQLAYYVPAGQHQAIHGYHPPSHQSIGYATYPTNGQHYHGNSDHDHGDNRNRH